jgi:hypothetical protein
MRYILFFCIFWVLSGCAHKFDGYATQRAEASYGILIPHLPTKHRADQFDALYHAAFEICRNDHKTGFKVDSREFHGANSGSLEAVITCSGPVDSNLVKKHGGTELQMEKNRSASIHNYRLRFRFAPVVP